MKCPKCGYMRQNRDNAFVPATECPSCGIVYAKHDTIAAPVGSALPASSPPHLRPSVVDPESLKKARDRVEKRLRQRIETPTRDDRHAQTLDLARKIAAEERPSRDNAEDQYGGEEEPNAPLSSADQTTEPQTIESKTEDALLLEEMVGVQLHSGKNDIEEIEAAANSELEEPAPEQTEADESQHEVPDPIEAQTENQPEQSAPQWEDQPGDPENIQVETVRLTSQMTESESVSTESDEPEPTDDADSAMEENNEMPPAYIAAAAEATGFVTKLTRLLPVVAWMILIAGVIGAILSWTTISDVEAGVRIPVADPPSTVPLGLLLGFAYLATGALGFAFFWVSSMISRQLKDIRQMLVKNAQATDEMPDYGQNQPE